MANDKKYVIVSDLDGTFFASNGEPTQNNLAAVERFKKAGHCFTIATGRFKNKWCECANAPCILANGTFMLDVTNGKIINERTFESKSAYELLKEIRDVFGDIRVRYTDRNDVHYLFASGDEDEFGEQWYKIVFESVRESENDTPYMRADLLAMSDYLRKNYPDRFRYNFSAPFLFELLQHGASKGVCIGDLKDYFKDRGEDVTVVAVGDYENDMEMLAAADIAACPSNALPSVLEYVESRLQKGSGIIVSDNDSGAVSDLVDKLLNS
ncbi:MAG: HAD family phosphatase [Clostridia bacterium]|nr:HAD family phosphatase [Clostridia bacterium]